MKQQIAAGMLAVSLIGGVGTGFMADQMRPDATKEKPNATPSATATTPATTPAPEKTTPAPPKQTIAKPVKPVLQPASSLTIFASSVGPVKLGMSKNDALATGYLVADVPVPSCGIDQLQWKPDYKWALDIDTYDDGSVASMAVNQPGPRTRSGLQVGSTYVSVKSVLGEGAAPVVAGNDQTGLFVNEGDNWMGFLFDATPETVTDDTPVKLIEVRLGAKPNLVQGGC